MTTPTPEDRLRTVESRIYTIQAVAEALSATASHAHLTDRHDLGFMIGLLADRLRHEVDAVLTASTRG